MNNNEYIIEAQNTLFAFQMLEEALKIRIGLFYDVNEASRPNNYDPEKMMRSPLTPLIGMYKTALGDASIIKHMESAVPWRNFCAHNAFLHWIYSKTSSSPYTTHSIDDFRQVKKFTMELIDLLIIEIKSLQRQTSKPIPSLSIPLGSLSTGSRP